MPGCDGAGTAERSYPASKVRGSGREELPHTPKPEGRVGGREELLHAPTPEARGSGRVEEVLMWLPRSPESLGNQKLPPRGRDPTPLSSI